MVRAGAESECVADRTTLERQFPIPAGHRILVPQLQGGCQHGVICLHNSCWQRGALAASFASRRIVKKDREDRSLPRRPWRSRADRMTPQGCRASLGRTAGGGCPYGYGANRGCGELQCIHWVVSCSLRQKENTDDGVRSVPGRFEHAGCVCRPPSVHFDLKPYALQVLSDVRPAGDAFPAGGGR
jgi:hypothetical protein